jgi:putative ABC transport system ATP-binding protein
MVYIKKGNSMNDIILRCQDISKTFETGHREIKVLDKINFHIYPGETVLLFGKSGQGKSVFLSLLSGLDFATSGDVYFDGVWFQSCTPKRLEFIRRSQIGIIFQNLNLIPSWTALENVEAALEDIVKSSKLKRSCAITLLGKIGLADRLYRFPGELSMGEQQRVAVARTLIKRPKLIIADEPTGDLDLITSEQIINLLRSYTQKTNAALLVATHGSYPDSNFDRTLILDNGNISSLNDELKMETIISINKKHDPVIISSN